MSQKIVSCSVSEEQFERLKEMKCSASKMLQVKIDEMWENCEDNPETYKQYQRKFEAWKKLADDRGDFLEKKGLIEEFLEKYG